MQPNTEATPSPSLWEYLCRKVLEIIAGLSPCRELQLLTTLAQSDLGAATGLPGGLTALIHRCVSELQHRGCVEIHEEQIAITDAGLRSLGTPEPTMEEILASIRRIISDDEANAAQQRATTADYPEQVRAEDAEEEAADTQIIDDIARVLSGGSAPAGGDDHIHDFLTELGVSEARNGPVGAAPAEVELVLVEETVLQTEVYAVPDFAAAFPSTDQSLSEPAPSSLSEPPQPAEMAASAQDFASGIEPAREEPTTALERAIAALKAGDLSAFAREAGSDFAAPAPAQATPAAAPLAEPSIPEPEPAARMALEEPLALDEPVILGEPELEPAPAAWSAGSESWPDSVSTPETEAAPAPWRGEDLSWGTSASTPPLQPSCTRLGQAPLDFQGPLTSRALDWERAGSSNLPPSQGWLVENIPRRMRAYVPVEAEIRVPPRITSPLVLGLVGQGRPVLHPLEVTTAMSLRLSAPKGGIGIEAQCPETQWVQRNASPTDRDFAAWRFTLTPQKRGSHILRLTFSYREIDVNGVIADSTLPDRVFDVVVTTNVTKICAQAAVWGSTLVAGAALGAYFQPAMQFLTRLYR